MGKMKKILAAGVVCYVAYKLGKKYLKENNLTAEDVFDSAKKKAEEFARQAAGVVPTTKVCQTGCRRSAHNKGWGTGGQENLHLRQGKTY